jgi:CsoR family transcriptional regulator, copper-sensing transcriptional repressor
MQPSSSSLSNSRSNAFSNHALSADEAVSHQPHEHGHSDHEPIHVHSQESVQRISNRLSRLEGHIRGIKTMVQESRPCPEVLIQIAAVRGALDRVARLILDEHLNECITRAVNQGNIEAELEELKAALDRFLT